MKLFTVTALLAIATEIQGKTFWVTETTIETVYGTIAEQNTEHWYKTRPTDAVALQQSPEDTKLDFDPAEDTIATTIVESPVETAEAVAAPAAATDTTSTETINKKATAPTTLVEATETTLSDSIYGELTNVADADYSKQILDAHNAKRSLHGVGKLSWSRELYNFAQGYANKMDCANVNLVHSGQYSENLIIGPTTAQGAVDGWYNEITTYDWSNQKTYDHFTQVIWKGSTKLGCAYKDCRSTNWGLYTVCAYDPAGNMIGSAKENVMPLI